MISDVFIQQASTVPDITSVYIIGWWINIRKVKI